MNIGYQGEPGAYSELAAQQYFHNTLITTRPFDSFISLLDGVTEGACDYAMLPIENASAGTVIPALDALRSYPVHAVGEYHLPIAHALLAHSTATAASITSVYSHPQALAQCQHYLNEHHYDAIPYFDTAAAARFIAESNSTTMAAIASELAAEHYGLNIIETPIADAHFNQTRFLVVTQQPAAYSNNATKMTLLLTLNHTPNALAQVLTTLGKHQLNLSNIASRPCGDTAWHYEFLIEGITPDNCNEKNYQHIISSVLPFCHQLRLVGKYMPHHNSTH